tara:strand:+ start:10758 stop:11276 length:519 start_codon:yes stop_codon:yes gene_type:complete
MPLIYHLNGAIGPSVNMGVFIAGIQAHVPPPVAGGPLPGQLPVAPTTNLMVGQTHLQPIGGMNSKTFVIGLLTCAAVLYVSVDPHAVAGVWLHHANVGHIVPADVVAARAGLGNPPWASIRIIFAHQGASDPGYIASLATMVAQGIIGNNIIHIPNLTTSHFGVHNTAFIGI